MIVFNSSKIRKIIKVDGVEAHFPQGESTHDRNLDLIAGFVKKHPHLSIVEKQTLISKPEEVAKEEAPESLFSDAEFEIAPEAEPSSNRRKHKKKNKGG